jgi:uncharacterized protein YndB with AHSA1/START domain
MNLIIKAGIQIQKPLAEVFEGIVNPEKMTQYFISESSGRLEEGREIIWKWPEFPDYECVVNNIKVEKNHLISFVWDNETTVTIKLEEQTDNSVVVRITEGEKEMNEASLKWFGENTEGWANFLASMKAYLEHGINLRTGAFEFMRGQLPSQNNSLI